MMAGAGRLLGFAGRNGPLLLLFGVMVGLVAPVFAEATRPLMGLAVFIFTLGAFLKVDAAAFRAEATDRSVILAILTWTTFGVPLLAFALLKVVPPDPD